MTEPEPAETPGSAAEPTPPRRRARLLLPLVLLVALAVGVSGSIAWWNAAHSKDLATAHTRDAALVAAKQEIATLNTLDYRAVDKGLKSWLAVTTGTLKDQLAGVGAQDQQLLADQEKISTGKVVDAAVLDLDGNAATVIAAVEVTVRDGENAAAEPTVKRNRFKAELVRVGGTWKLSSLDQVAVDVR